MKKAAYVVLILTLAIFLVNPLSSEARGGFGGGGGHWSGGGGHGGSGSGAHWGSGTRDGYNRGAGVARGSHWGGGGWWPWWPWAVVGGAAVLWPYYSPYYEPPPVIIQEEPPVYVQPAGTPSSAEKIFVYPRQGQSEELQAKDRYECHSWAVSQTQYNPTQPATGDMPVAQRNQMLADYRRAEDACLDGRGYTVK
jgi:hypothetical protein